MKKLLTLLACLAMVLSLVGCDAKKNTPAGDYSFCEYGDCEDYKITENKMIYDGEEVDISYDDEKIYVHVGDEIEEMKWSKDNNGNLILEYDGERVFLEKK